MAKVVIAFIAEAMGGEWDAELGRVWPEPPELYLKVCEAKDTEV